MSWLPALLEPFGYAFFVNGFIVATVAGALCGMSGVYVTLRGMSYLGHGLSHALFGGFAAASVIEVNYYLGAGLWGVATALLITKVARSRGIGADTATGVITTASFALGVALLTVFGSRGPSFDAALFGSILGVRPFDVAIIVMVTLLAATVLTARYRALLFTTFDPDVATTSGIRTARMDALLMTLLALTILASLTVIGATLVAAILVIPASIARMLAPSFAALIPLAAGIGALTGMVGMTASYHINVPSGTVIVLVGAILFTATYWLTGRRTRRVATAATRPPR